MTDGIVIGLTLWMFDCFLDIISGLGILLGLIWSPFGFLIAELSSVISFLFYPIIYLLGVGIPLILLLKGFSIYINIPVVPDNIVGGQSVSDHIYQLYLHEYIWLPLYHMKCSFQSDSKAVLEMKLRRSMSESAGDKTILNGVSVRLESLGVRSEAGALIRTVKCYIFEPHVYNQKLPEWDKESTMFYYHGGAWCVGSVDNTHFQFIQNLALKLNMRIISPEYRLAPEHPFPAGFDDCFMSTKCFIQKLDLKNYHFTGDSAGGNISCQNKKKHIPQYSVS